MAVLLGAADTMLCGTRDLWTAGTLVWVLSEPGLALCDSNHTCFRSYELMRNQVLHAWGIGRPTLASSAAGASQKGAPVWRVMIHTAFAASIVCCAEPNKLLGGSHQRLGLLKCACNHINRRWSVCGSNRTTGQELSLEACLFWDTARSSCWQQVRSAQVASW